MAQDKPNARKAKSRPLVEHLARLDTPERLRRAWLLDEVFAPLGIDQGSALEDACEDIVVDVISDDESFRIRPLGWRVDLDPERLRGLLAGAILGGVLQMIVGDDIPAEAYPHVVSVVVDVPAVTIDRRERVLVVPIPLARDGAGVTPQILFNRLPPGVRSLVGFDDFEHLCERLVKAARLGAADFGEVRVLDDADSSTICLTWA